MTDPVAQRDQTQMTLRVLAEASRMMFEELIMAGFDRSHAAYLTGVWLAALGTDR